MFVRDVLALRPARHGAGLFPEPVRPRVSREGRVSDLIPLAGGSSVLVRDVPAAAKWRAGIGGAEGLRVEPAEFTLLSGGHVVLDVLQE